MSLARLASIASRRASLASRMQAMAAQQLLITHTVPRPLAARRMGLYATHRSMLPSLQSVWMNRFGATDVTTHDDRIEFQVDAPGLSKEDLSINVSMDNVLTIKGSRSSQSSSEAAEPPADTAAEGGSTEKVEAGDGGSEVASTEQSETAVSQAPSGQTRWSERSFSSFTRSFQLPSTAKVDEISADLKDGVLTLTVPTEAPRSIEINVE